MDYTEINGLNRIYDVNGNFNTYLCCDAITKQISGAVIDYVDYMNFFMMEVFGVTMDSYENGMIILNEEMYETYLTDEFISTIYECLNRHFGIFLEEDKRYNLGVLYILYKSLVIDFEHNYSLYLAALGSKRLGLGGEYRLENINISKIIANDTGENVDMLSVGAEAIGDSVSIVETSVSNIEERLMILIEKSLVPIISDPMIFFRLSSGFDTGNVNLSKIVDMIDNWSLSISSNDIFHDRIRLQLKRDTILDGIKRMYMKFL